MSNNTTIKASSLVSNYKDVHEESRSWCLASLWLLPVCALGWLRAQPLIGHQSSPVFENMSWQRPSKFSTVSLRIEEAFTESRNISSSLYTCIPSHGIAIVSLQQIGSIHREAFVHHQLSIHMSMIWKDPCTSIILFPLTYNHERE